MTGGLTYWRCPECGERIVAPNVGVDWWETFDAWDLLPITAARCEQMVEAHEATHLGGAA